MSKGERQNVCTASTGEMCKERAEEGETGREKEVRVCVQNGFVYYPLLTHTITIHALSVWTHLYTYTDT